MLAVLNAPTRKLRTRIVQASKLGVSKVQACKPLLKTASTLALTAIGFSLVTTLSACSEPVAKSGKVASSGKADIGGAFTLVNQDNKIVTDQTFAGKPQLIYFGFTYCPDICPTALIQMGIVQDRLAEKGKDIQYIFISVDPERDTPELLKQYVTANGFPDGLIGLTGTLEQVEATKNAFKVYSSKVKDASSAGDYMVDHSSIIYFMDAEGELVDFFTHKSSPLDMATHIRVALDKD